MVEPHGLSIVLSAKDAGVEEDKEDDEPEHCLKRIIILRKDYEPEFCHRHSKKKCEDNTS